MSVTAAAPAAVAVAAAAAAAIAAAAAAVVNGISYGMEFPMALLNTRELATLYSDIKNLKRSVIYEIKTLNVILYIDILCVM